MRSRFFRLLRGIVVGAVIAYGLAVYVMYTYQRAFQYDTSGEVLPLAETELRSAELVEIPTSAGEVIHGWYQPPAGNKPLILYFRGNSQSFAREHARYETFVAAGYGFLAFDYRGFPASPGELTEANVLADGLAAFDWVAAREVPVVIWGRSLGSGPATYVASQRDAHALLLESPFLSAVDTAADRYPMLPVYWLMRDQYHVDQWITAVSEPVFVAHGTADETIGIRHGRAVYALAPNPDGLMIVEGAGHSDLWEHGLWDEAQDFFERAMAAP